MISLPNTYADPIITQHPLWHYLLTHYKEKGCLVEGPLNNLQPSMIQFPKPRRTLVKSMDQYRRHDTSAREYLNGGNPNAPMSSGSPSRFDASFYRTHDALNYIPSDLRSQATYSSGLPIFGTTGPFSSNMSVQSGRGGPSGAKRSAYGSYASSIISQDGPVDSGSSVVPSVSERVAYSQSDRLRRRTSFGSVGGQSEMSSLISGATGFDYKSQDEAVDMDDMKSQYAGTQSGVTAF